MTELDWSTWVNCDGSGRLEHSAHISCGKGEFELEILDPEDPQENRYIGMVSMKLLEEGDMPRWDVDEIGNLSIDLEESKKMMEGWARSQGLI